MTDPKAETVRGFTLETDDLETAAGFYRGVLGFTPEEDSGRGDRLRLSLGDERVTLVLAEAAGGPPAPADAPAFQHLAIVVSDMTAAFGQVSAYGGSPISHGGPQRLPPASGGVTAWKFRAPDGQPLELLETPTAAWITRARARPGAVFLGIDHTAFGCSDLEASLAFYAGLGFTRGAGSHNVGPEQDRLDGVTGADVRVATMHARSGEGPHLEFLHYASAAAGVFARSRVVTRVETVGGEGERRDPDGHRLQLIPQASSRA